LRHLSGWRFVQGNDHFPGSAGTPAGYGRRGRPEGTGSVNTEETGSRKQLIGKEPEAENSLQSSGSIFIINIMRALHGEVQGLLLYDRESAERLHGRDFI